MHSTSPLRLGIIGHPLSHTLSPLLHEKLMQVMGVTGEYKAYEVDAGNLADCLNNLGDRGLRGLNVTIPHKVAVLPLMDWLSPEAEVIGAVNTIVFEEFGRLMHGFNTDVDGFARSLPEAVIERLPESHVLVLGGGGSARAVLTALSRLNTAEVTMALRDPAKAVPLKATAENLKLAYGCQTELGFAAIEELSDFSLYSGLINTTPVGMWPQEDSMLIPSIQLETLAAGAFIYDLIYRPLETRLLRDARALGYETYDGLDMLIYQGIAAFERWQDQPVPLDVLPGLRADLTQALLHSIQ